MTHVPTSEMLCPPKKRRWLGWRSARRIDAEEALRRTVETLDRLIAKMEAEPWTAE